MQHVIWKYELLITGETILELQRGAQIRHIAWQDSMYGEGPMIWFQLDPSETLKEVKYFRLIQTGEGVPCGATYLESIESVKGLVFHVFETLGE
jgi:hypothetical protein